MTSTRPYLIRAFYDWIIDNNCTPHLVVNAGYEGVEVPQEYVDNGQIVLNVSITAVQGLVLGDDAVEFQARFGGKVYKIYAPVASILAIYAKENGRGMVFAEEEIMDQDAMDQEASEMEFGHNLELVAKSDQDFNSDHKNDHGNGNGQDDDKNGGKNGGNGNKGRGRGHLSLVK